MRKAFTLSEVLITLGIIGLVAALTIPTLFSKYRQRTVETRLLKFYSASNQAVKLSELENGQREFWPKCETLEACKEWYNKYLNNYLKTIKVEHTTLNTRPVNIAYFADGSLVIIKNGYDYVFYPVAGDFDKEKSIENNENNIKFPDRGKRSFIFAFGANSNQAQMSYYKGKGIEPYRTLYCETVTNEQGEKVEECNSITRESLYNDPVYGCNKNALNTYCTAIIQDNNWKIPDDYPYKF